MNVSLLIQYAWPMQRLMEAMESLAQHTGIATKVSPAQISEATDNHPQYLQSVIAAGAEALNIEVKPVAAHYPRLKSALLRASPAFVHIQSAQGSHLLLICGARGNHLRLLGNDLKVRLVSCDAVVHALSAPYTENIPTDVDGLLAQVGIDTNRNKRARHAILCECLRTVSVDGCWIIRATTDGPWLKTLRSERLAQRLLLFASAHVAQLSLVLLTWSVIGQTAFNDHGLNQWLWIAVLALFSAIPFQLLGVWAAGLITLDFGAKLKQRLLLGALNLTQEEVRHDGAGKHLGRVVESESFETVLLTGAAAGVVALIELGFAAVVLSLGAAGAVHTVLLLAWSVFSAVLMGRYYLRRRAWSERRLQVTNKLVERMLGHQTRLAQESESAWHRNEDQELTTYCEQAKRMDHGQLWLTALQTRGWMVLGIASMAGSFINPSTTAVQLAVSLGGVVLAQRALAQLATSFSSLTDAVIGWRIIRPLFHAAEAVHQPSNAAETAIGSAQELLNAAASSPLDDTHAVNESPTAAPTEPLTSTTSSTSVLLETHDLCFCYPNQNESVFSNCTLTVSRGDRILLDGPSGSGKSTLAAVLAGIREPSSGLLLYKGLDIHSLGAQVWRRRIALAPQFHENYIVSGTLAFNLLMGRRWPATEQDLQMAQTLCEALELGELLARMPNGLQQIVGETGWQLSHGERNRVYLARALLQDAEILILDESFAALDPQTLQICMRVLIEQQCTMILIAHP